MAAVPPDSPLGKAWAKFKTTSAYADNIANGSHVEVAMWAAFVEGWMMALGFTPRPVHEGRPEIGDARRGRRK